MSKRMNEQTQYGVGVLWLVKQNKLIVTGFARGSAAREAGVRAGDILKAVDDIDVFHMAHATLGVNPVGQLLSGPVNSDLKIVPGQGLWNIDMYGECSDGDLTSKMENHGMAECPPHVDNDVINMSSAPY